jgi:hypothetical protein
MPSLLEHEFYPLLFLLAYTATMGPRLSGGGAHMVAFGTIPDTPLQHKPHL